MYVLVSVIVIVLLVLIWIVSMANGLIRKKNKVNEAASGIEVALTKRYDMLTKLLDVAKGYAAHEKEVFTDIIKMRSGMSLSEMQEADASMDRAGESLKALAENYPQLRSDTVFRELQVGIRDAEDHLQAARRVYNSNATAYNTAQEVFPTNIIAGMRHLEKVPLYTAETAKKEDVKMTF